MKRSLFLCFLLGAGFVMGCSSATPDMTKQMEKAKKSDFPNKAGVERQTTPEFIAEHAETPRERAN